MLRGIGDRRDRDRRRTPSPGRARVYGLGAFALFMMMFALRSGGIVLVATVAMIVLACLATIVRLDLYKAGLVSTCAYVAVCSWTGWHLGGSLRPRALFLILAILFLIAAHANGRLPRIPGWYTPMVVAVIIDAVLDLLIPTDPQYLAQRYATSSSSGFALHLTTGLTDFGTAARFLLTLVGTVGVVSICALHFPKAPMWIALSYVGGAALSGWVAFSDYLHITALGHAVTGLPILNGRASGFTDHPNLLAGACVFATAIVAWLAVHESGRMRIAGLVMLPGLVFGTFASGSRGGAICLAGAALLCLMFIPQYRRMIAFGLAGLGIMAALVFAATPSLGHKILVTVRLAGNSGPSNTGRIAVLKQGLHDWEHSPVWGIGLHVIDEAHNVLVQALASGGLILLFAYLALQIGAALAAGRMRFDHPLGPPLFVTVVVGFVFDNLENTLTEPFVYVPITLVVAILVQRAAQASQPPVGDVPADRRPRTMLSESVG